MTIHLTLFVAILPVVALLPAAVLGLWGAPPRLKLPTRRAPFRAVETASPLRHAA